MATATFTLTPANNEAAYEAIIDAIIAALASFGLVQTADTGQYNPASANTPPTANNRNVYTIWRFDDALQSTMPVFFRVDFGSGSSQGTTFGISVQVGTGTNGAGTLTGQIGAQINMQSASVSPTQTSYLSGDVNRLSFALWAAHTVSAPVVFTLERLRDATGAETDEGVFYLGAWGGAASAISEQVVPKTGAVPTAVSGWSCAVPRSGTTSGAIGSDVGVYPIHPWHGYILNPCVGMLICHTTDIAAENIVSVSMYGTARDYLRSNVNSNTAPGSNSRPLVLYE